MCPVAFLLATAVLGIQVGWQPLPKGGVQYIIELSPEAMESLRSGESIESDIPLPPEVLREVRSYRIFLHNKEQGHKELPQQLPSKPAAAPDRLPPNPASRPLPEQTTAFDQPSSTTAGTASNAAGPARAETAVSSTAAMTSSAATGSGAAAQPSPEKPWLPLWLTIVALFASLGANFFLAWITWDARTRYRTLLGRVGS